MMSKIKDNESIKPFLAFSKLIETGCNLLDTIPFIYTINPKLKEHRNQLIQIVQDSRVLTLPDQFNDLFSKDGWICYGGLSQTILEKCIYLGSINKYEEAKELLINYIDQNKIDFILKKCTSREHFKDRLDLLKLLKIDYLNERYHACIPLLLALIDGLVNDISRHVGFFAEKSDLELYDSITSHETGLPFLKVIMNTSRTKTAKERILIPYRNGILHGRDLNFANKEVASKCWWVLDCLIDWADEKAVNKQPEEPISLKESLEKYQMTQELSKRINEWKMRPIKSENYWENQMLETLDSLSPEYTLLIFLNAWKEQQWGKMFPILLHTIGKHQGKTMLEIKNDYQKIKLLKFRIKSSEDQTPSSTKISTHLEYVKNDITQSLYIEISLNYANAKNGYPELRGEPNGNWYILQLSLGQILFN
ncbi:hypothetical protein HXZ95_08195 [Acinetobacter pseudolwoffii]|nr:hypothetical protein [Acinetobacter pseudolwoffii]